MNSFLDEEREEELIIRGLYDQTLLEGSRSSFPSIRAIYCLCVRRGVQYQMMA
jgi:hypothetical protein